MLEGIKIDPLATVAWLPEEFEIARWEAIKASKKAFLELNRFGVSEKEALLAVYLYNDALKFLKNQTPKLCKAAVKKNGLALQWVEKRSKTICMEALLQNSEAIKWVPSEYEDIIMIMIKARPSLIRFVKKPSEEVTCYAVRHNPNLFKYLELNAKTVAVCLEAVKKDNSMFDFVPTALQAECYARYYSMQQECGKSTI